MKEHIMIQVAEKTKKFAQLAFAGLILATGTVAAQVAMQSPAMAQSGGGGGGGAGGGGSEGGGEGEPPGVFFREERALTKALIMAQNRPGTTRPRVRKPWQPRDCDLVVFRATSNGPHYECRIMPYNRFR